jgi:hypothetical protein
MKRNQYTIAIIVILTICLLFIFNCNSQQEEEEVEFVDIFQDKEFKEDFNNNSNNWYIGEDDSFASRIENGSLFFEHKREQGDWHNYNEIEIDQNNDFYIQTTIELIEGNEDGAYGLVWGAKDEKNYYLLLINTAGKYLYGKNVNGRQHIIADWKEAEFINKGNAKNAIAVKRSENIIEILINGEFAYTGEFQPFFGYFMGFVLVGRQMVKVNSLIVTEFY